MSNKDNGNVRDLFGGALSCFLPTNALDMSEIREVPNNQEVFHHQKTDQSIMFDILEYQDQVHGSEAIKYHYMDIAEVNDASEEAEVNTVEEIPKENLSIKECSQALFLLGRQMISKYKEGADAKNLVNILMVLYRLPQYETDLLIIMNDPVAISTKSSSSGNNTTPNDASKWSEKLFKQIACSLKIVDSSLFG